MTRSSQRADGPPSVPDASRILVLPGAGDGSGERDAELLDRSILVVDDDPLAIKLVCQMLHGYRNLRFATSGADALRLVRASPPDLILLDGEMPEQNGFEVCMLLKADPAYRHIPIIFVTAHDDVAFETYALTIGAADFLSKPLSGPKARLRVSLHLRLKQQIEQLSQHRRCHPARQPAPPRGGPGLGVEPRRARRHTAVAAADRYRLLQGVQRRVRPPPGRSLPARGRPGDQRGRAPAP